MVVFKKTVIWILLSLISVSVTAGANAGGQFRIVKQSFSPSHSAISGGEYEIRGTFGQPLIQTSQGGAFVIQSGFWRNSNVDLQFTDSFEGI